MLTKVNKELLGFLLRARIPSEQQGPIKEASAVKKPKRDNLQVSKESVLNTDEMAQRQREVAAGAGRPQRTAVETIIRDNPKIGRNERVTIIHTISGEEKELKFKQAEPLLNTKEWVLKS